MKSDVEIYDPRQLIAIGLFGALAIVMPQLFHVVLHGRMFLPMFIPVSIASFLLTLRYSLTLCILVPIMSFAITGMPPLVPIGIIMILELTFLAIFNNLFYRHLKWNIYVSAILSLIINRIIYLAILFIGADLLKIPKMSFALYSAIKYFPGLILLIILVPMIVLPLNKSNFFKGICTDGNR